MPPRNNKQELFAESMQRRVLTDCRHARGPEMETAIGHNMRRVRIELTTLGL